MSVLDKMLAAKGISRAEFIDRRTRLGKEISKNGVGASRCLERVMNLPRRAPEVDDDLITQVSRLLNTKDGKLRPLQCLALVEMVRVGGLLGGLEVGAGKTLVSFLAPTVLGSVRPLLLVPANLREKTKRDFWDLREKGWKGRSMSIMSYEMLGRADHAKDIEEYNPDLLIADECARLKNLRAAVTKRVNRVMRGGTCKFVGLSGTVVQKSLHDWAHLVEWALGGGSPLPLDWPTLNEWAQAIDPHVELAFALHPGKLLELPPYDEDREADVVTRARSGLRKRVRETHGCVVSSFTRVGASIQMGWRKVPVTREIKDAFKLLREHWETPSGEPLFEATAVWRAAQQLALGFFYEWDPPAPEEWLRARKAWSSACREILTTNRSGLDSELQVVRAVDSGKYPEYARVLGDWRACRDSFKPNTVARWITHDVLDSLVEREGTAIYWTQHVEFGRALAKRMAVPYCGVEGRAEGTKTLIDDFAGRTVVASIHSCGEGRNLQAWSRNIVTCAPANGKVWEQLIGRTHREGQQADVVEFEIVDGCEESHSALDKAKIEARFVQETTGAPQRLLLADWTD